MQGGMDQRSHVVCQDLIDTSVSSHLARIAEHGAGLLGMLWWEALRGGSRSCLCGQCPLAGAAARHSPPLHRDGAGER